MEVAFDIKKRREEIIDFLSQRLPENQVLEIRALLSNYFFDSAEEQLEKLAKDKGWDNSTYEKWANEHWRQSNSNK